MIEIPALEIYKIIILPQNEEDKVERLEKELNKSVIVTLDKLAYTGKLCKNLENNFYLKYQTTRGIEEKIIDTNSTNVIFVKQI